MLTDVLSKLKPMTFYQGTLSFSNALEVQKWLGKIAKKYGYAATKTAAIINYAIAPLLHTPLVEHLQQNPFSPAIDDSSDTGTEIMYPLVVRVYDVNKVRFAQGSGICV